MESSYLTPLHNVEDAFRRSTLGQMVSNGYPMCSRISIMKYRIQPDADTYLVQASIARLATCLSLPCTQDLNHLIHHRIRFTAENVAIEPRVHRCIAYHRRYRS